MEDLPNSILPRGFLDTPIFGSLLLVVVTRRNGFRTFLPRLQVNLGVQSGELISFLERRSISAARQ